jgi:hypothetical protein
MTNIFRASVVASLAIVLSACALFGGPEDRKLRNTPSFRAGYDDGCAAANNRSANFRDGPSADTNLYSTDALYRRGWANGYQTCQPTGVAPGDTPYQPMQGPTPNSGIAH